MIRPYKIADKKQLIELLRLNTPQYFDPSEEADFIRYLNDFTHPYFVVEKNNRIVGCGGFSYFEEQSVVRIAWDMIHPADQGKGIGKALTEYRINEIKKNPLVKLIIVRTSQLAYLFYKKFGFVLVNKEKDFWAKGFDLYQMEMKINQTPSN